MKSLCIVLLSVSLMLAGWPVAVMAQDERGYLVIVHADNSVTELPQKELSKFFLKKVKEWKETKQTVEPVDLAADSPIRAQFSEEIHERKLAAIKAYWQKEIFSGRAVPPVEKASDDEVLKFVSEHDGAIGYVSNTADISAYKDVKTVTILEAEK